MSKCVISGSGLYTPPDAIGNVELVNVFNEYVQRHNAEHKKAIENGEIEALAPSSVEFIEKASGIKNRYVMSKTGILDPLIMQPLIAERADDQPSLQCEMALAAADEALMNANRRPEEIDLVIVACSNMPRPYPALSIEIQHALGARGFGYDINVACSSATFGLQMAVDTLCNNHAETVLLVNPEVCSAHLNFRDRDSHFIFGDACTAMIIEKQKTCRGDQSYEIVSTKLATQFSNHIRNNFGFMNRLDPTSIGQCDKLFYQQGRKVFKEIPVLVVQHITNHLESLGYDPEQIQRFWLHQANANMNHNIAEKLLGQGSDLLRVPLILDRYANTSSAGSIIAFHLYHDDLKTNDLGLLCSFGAGYSIGSVLLRKN